MSEDLKHTPEILSAKDLQEMGFSRSMSYRKRCTNSTRRVNLKMRKIEYVVSNERLITPSGLSLVGQVLGKQRSSVGICIE